MKAMMEQMTRGDGDIASRFGVTTKLYAAKT